MMGFKFSKKSIGHMSGVHPELVMVFMEAIMNSPIDFGVPATGGLRTAEDQNELHKSGASPYVDGYKKLSKHQRKPGASHSTALDIYAYVNGKASWDKVHLAMVAAVILATAKRMKDEGHISITVKWGGEFGSNDFRGWDYPHFEVA